ncbi:hypothetical protein Moror_3711, partial [Moniliophthora roreri MCA 2997]
SITTIAWAEEVGERRRTVMGQGNSFLGLLSLVFITFAARCHRQNVRKPATSPNLLSTKVNTPGLNLWHTNHQESSPGVLWVAEHIYDVAEDSRRRLCINFDINKTLSSSLRFQPQPTPHKYARDGFRRHLRCHELDTVTISPPRTHFQTQKLAPRYTRESVLAYSG